ncbi:MAG: class I SAM-dependent methyltransferase [Deltaproteobacteria bacterium]|nr:class I SAM-dependent methyltransferase [Deltaproteobacteria bacterium]
MNAHVEVKSRDHLDEVDAIRDRYSRRKGALLDSIYSLLSPWNYMWAQEKERALIKWIKYSRLEPLGDKKLLEIGCGKGNNLLQMVRLGFMPENLVGNDLLDERVQEARRLLPSGVNLVAGDAMQMRNEHVVYNVVMQSTVFSSILDSSFQIKLAKKMWHWVKPGGGILWYDFVYNNPRNKDVGGIPLSRVRDLFPESRMKHWRVTLAPPIARLVTRLHPSFYTIFNMLPFLRTHVLCWIQKEEE